MAEATIADRLLEEISRSKEAGPSHFGAWTMHQKALDASRGVSIRAGAKDGFAGSAGVNPYYSGPGSLFGVLGASADIISTRVQPRGIAGTIPAVPSQEEYPYFPYLTGFLADSTASEPNGPCDDPIEAGPGKSCFQTAQYGRYSRMTRTEDITRVGERINRGEFLDLRLLNDPLLMTGGQTGSDMTTPQINGNPSIFQETLMRMVEVGVSTQNLLSRQIWAGNPANNTGGNGYREFPGLDILIGTTKVDAFTNAACPSLASVIMDFASQRVDSNGTNIVMAVAYMARNLKYNSDRMNLDPTTWVIAMRQEAFYEISAVWPCAYLTSRCTSVTIPGSASTNLFVDANEQIRMRDEMRQGRFLLIDGERWPVVFDDGIIEDTGDPAYPNYNASLASGCFSSNIYFLPITTHGGVAALYFNYFDWSGQFAAMSALAEGAVPQGYYYTDGGRFLWHMQPPINYCNRWTALIKPRLVLKTPQLAGRINNVGYCPVLHTREPFPDDPYFVNGGVSTNRALPSLYADWGTVS